jgi:hypothetical protein
MLAHGLEVGGRIERHVCTSCVDQRLCSQAIAIAPFALAIWGMGTAMAAGSLAVGPLVIL